jgi:hypothetical protein
MTDIVNWTVASKALFDEDEEIAFFSTSVKNLIGSSYESTHARILDHTDTLDTLLSLLAHNKHHRVLVNTNDHVSILTHTDLIRYIFENQENFPSLTDLLSHPCHQFRMLARKQDTEQMPELAKIAVYDTALVAFQTLYQYQVSALAVVDSTCSLVANISCSDLRGIVKESLQVLNKPVYKFLEEHTHRLGDMIKADQLRTCSEMDSLEKVVRMVL